MARKNEGAVQLAAFFRRNGYVRLQDPARAATEGAQAYKKGDEIRLVAWTKGELAVMRRLLKESGFPLAKPFEKNNQWRQPIYGRVEVARFLDLVQKHPAREAPIPLSAVTGRGTPARPRGAGGGRGATAKKTPARKTGRRKA